MAESVRLEHDLGHGPVLLMSDFLANNIGIPVSYVEKSGSDAAVRTVKLVGSNRHGLEINLAAPAESQRVRLACELGNIVFRSWPAHLVTAVKAEVNERRARAFARHFLMPAEALLSKYASHGRLRQEEFLNEVVRQWRVDPALAAEHLLDLKLVTNRIAAWWSSFEVPGLAARYGWTDEYQDWRQQGASGICEPSV